MFDEVIMWDERHDNSRGKMDVLGHKKTALTLLADDSREPTEKASLLTQALECTEEALKIGEALNMPEGALAIQKVHLASLYIKRFENPAEADNVDLLNNAIEILDSALKVFSGSKAHRAWPLGIKARALHLLKKDTEALETLTQAQLALFEGYDEEVGTSDQSAMKLRIWSAGIMLGFAEIYLAQNKPILAEIYASAVLATPDPENSLVARKKQAEKFMENLKG
jgi:hypothetical protein